MCSSAAGSVLCPSAAEIACPVVCATDLMSLSVGTASSEMTKLQQSKQTMVLLLQVIKLTEHKLLLLLCYMSIQAR